MELLTLSIGVGLVIGLLFSELFGLAAGGVVVPGYLALYLTQPEAVLFTLGSAMITFVIVRSSATMFVLYGRRRTALMILVGYLVGLGGSELLQDRFPMESESAVIGYIIPGLIAIWFDRQGPVVTTCALSIGAVVVRLVLILIVCEEVRG